MSQARSEADALNRTLSPALRTLLATINRDRKTGSPPTRMHYFELLNALGEAASWVDAELAHTVLWLIQPLNDLQRGITPPAFAPVEKTKEERETRSTQEINLIVTAVRAIDAATSKDHPNRRTEREAALQLVPVLRRRLADVRATTLQNWRGDLQRKSGGSLPPGAYLRYRRPPPSEAGQTPQERFAWYLAWLERETSGT